MGKTTEYSIYGEYLCDYRPYRCRLTDKQFSSKSAATEYMKAGSKQRMWRNAIDVHVEPVH